MVFCLGLIMRKRKSKKRNGSVISFRVLPIENHSSCSLPPALSPKLFWSFTFQLFSFVWSNPIESGCWLIAFETFILFYCSLAWLSGKFSWFSSVFFSEIACYFLCGFFTFFFSWSPWLTAIFCFFFTLPCSYFLEKNLYFLRGVSVYWNVVDTRGRRRRDNTKKLTVVKTFLNFIFLRWPAKEIFFNVSGIFHGRLSVGTDHRKKMSTALKKDLMSLWLRDCTVLLLLFIVRI